MSGESVLHVPTSSLDHCESSYDTRVTLLVGTEKDPDKDDMIAISKLNNKQTCENECSSITYQPDRFETTVKLECTARGHVESLTQATAATPTKDSLREPACKTSSWLTSLSLKPMVCRGEENKRSPLNEANGKLQALKVSLECVQYNGCPSQEKTRGTI